MNKINVITKKVAAWNRYKSVCKKANITPEDFKTWAAKN